VVGYSEMASRIRARRVQLGLTQEQLAARAQITTATLSRLERGRLAEPRLPTIDAIARALGVETGWVVSGGGVEISPEASATLDAFFATPAGASANPSERAALASAASVTPRGTRLTVAYLQAVLAAMRGFLAPDEVSAAELSDRIDRGEWNPG